jgi:polar amino acid transport system substrate-binding protein
VHIKPTKPVLNPNLTAVMFQELQSGQCDAVVYDIPIIGSERAANPTKFGPIVGRIVTHEEYGIVFQKGAKLRAPVSTVVRQFVEDGTIGKMQKKWLAADFAKLPVFK